MFSSLLTNNKMASAKGFAKFIIVITTVSAAIMELIDTSIVNVALTDISGSLGVSIEDISWVILCHCQCDHYSIDWIFSRVFW